MFRLFLKNGNLFYEKNTYVDKNIFLNQEPDVSPTYTYKEYKNRLPVPIWDGHSDTIECYNHVLETAFDNFKRNRTFI